MDSGDDQLSSCSNCGKSMPASNLATHQIYCEKFVKKCPKCGQPVDIKQMDEHMLEKHTKTKCELCQDQLSGGQIKNHQDTECPYRPLDCPYCQNRIPYNKFYQHQLECGSRTFSCQGCGTRMSIRNQQFHHFMCKNIDTEMNSKPKINGRQRQEKKERDVAPVGLARGQRAKAVNRHDESKDAEQDELAMAIRLSLEQQKKATRK